MLHLDNDKIISTKYKEDQFLGSDTIELIYDNNKPNELQFILNEKENYDILENDIEKVKEHIKDRSK